MTVLEKLLLLIPLLPLIASLVTAVWGRRRLRSTPYLPTVAALMVSTLLSLMLLAEVVRETTAARENPQSGTAGWSAAVDVWTWAEVDSGVWLNGGPPRDFRVAVTLSVDTLTALMLVMVTSVATLVAIYSAGYMRGDPGEWRFFTYISLFVFSMTMLVAAGNYLLLYMFWEAVGLCSYLLIGFWYQKPAAAAAGKKAFLVNRVGDFGFALALMLIWIHYGTFDYFDSAESSGVLSQSLRAGEAGPAGGAAHLAICLLLVAGACGKSAQVPLHVWLPDAMEGPTPVSALIHAATMVTAGVYMLVRSAPLFAVSPDAQFVIAVIGCTTLIVAAVIALVETDLKRVLAYSTVSQLGYMFLAVGTGTLAGVTSGMFHLLTHACFKALLFLGAGSVMHATGGVIDMRRLGGLRRRMPVTCATFLVGSLAISGVWPFAGFFSKDAILVSVFERGQANEAFSLMAWIAVAGGLLTSIYTFRAFYLTFFGAERIFPAAREHTHESPRTMTAPLAVLAAAALVVGWTGEICGELLAESPSLASQAGAELSSAGHAEHHGISHARVAGVAMLASILGIALASYLFLGGLREAEKLARWSGPLRKLAQGRFYFDEIYSLLIVRPGLALARWSDLLDRGGLDRLVDLVGAVPAAVARPLRRLQSGIVPTYSLLMVLGLLVLAGLVIRNL